MHATYSLTYFAVILPYPEHPHRTGRISSHTQSIWVCTTITSIPFHCMARQSMLSCRLRPHLDHLHWLALPWQYSEGFWSKTFYGQMLFLSPTNNRHKFCELWKYRMQMVPVQQQSLHYLFKNIIFLKQQNWMESKKNKNCHLLTIFNKLLQLKSDYAALSAVIHNLTAHSEADSCCNNSVIKVCSNTQKLSCLASVH